MESAARESSLATKHGRLKVVVLGATGATGLEVVRMAVERGHSVTAFVRSPERLSSFIGPIEVREGNLLDSSQLAQIVDNHDAVISAFGPPTDLESRRTPSRAIRHGTAKRDGTDEHEASCRGICCVSVQGLDHPANLPTGQIIVSRSCRGFRCYGKDFRRK